MAKGSRVTINYLQALVIVGEMKRSRRSAEKAADIPVFSFLARVFNVHPHTVQSDLARFVDDVPELPLNGDDRTHDARAEED